MISVAAFETVNCYSVPVQGLTLYILSLTIFTQAVSVIADEIFSIKRAGMNNSPYQSDMFA